MPIARISRISRPRFWLYEAGTFLVGIAIAHPDGSFSSTPSSIFSIISCVAFFLYFLFPANLYIYGINDMFDYETDKLNPKKIQYEALVVPSEHRALWRAIAWTTIPFLLFLYQASFGTIFAFTAFLFFAGFYSAKPIRAKSIPGLDSVFSAGHYVATGFFAYLLAGGAHLSYVPFVAAMAWAIAMHAYSAVPDIAADVAGGVRTIATLFGKRITILVCATLYTVAGIFSYRYLGNFALVFAAIYLLLMAASLRTKTNDQLFSLYKIFPIVNALGGMAIFFIILLSKHG